MSQCELFFSFFFFFFLYRWEEISKSLYLVIFVPRISQEFLFGSNLLPFLMSLEVLIQIPPPPSLSSFSLFKWESPLGDFLCSSFLNDNFASYFTPLAALVICCVVTSFGWAAWLLTLLVAISLLFLPELDRGYNSLNPISYSPSASLPRRDLSSSRARSHPNT